MLVAETLSLVALEPANGTTAPRFRVLHDNRILVAALIMELASQLRIGLHHGVVVVLDQLPSRHPLLTGCLRHLGAVSGRLDAASALKRMDARMPGTRDELLEGLVRRDILHPAIRKYRFFGPRLYPVRSTQAQNEGLQAMYRAAMGQETNMTALALLSLVCATGAIDQLLTFEEAETAKARLRELRAEIGAELVQADNDPNSETPDEIFAIALMSELEIQVKLIAQGYQIAS
jgi:hypothetical protein